MDETTEYNALLLFATSGDRNAYEFLDTVLGAAQTLDGLIDGDRVVDEPEIEQAFAGLFLDLSTNPFYNVHFEAMNAHLRVAFVNWRLATDLERGHYDDYDSLSHALDVAFVIRSSYVDLIVQVAYLLHGRDHAMETARRARAHAHMEGRAAYERDLAFERLCRSGA